VKGLILKDIYNLKGNVKMYVAILLLYIILGIQNSNGSMFCVMLGVLSLILTINNYAYDEKANWEKVALTMPITKHDLVKSKYFFCLLILIPTLLLAVACQFLFPTESLKNGLMFIISIFAVYGIITSVVIPLLFKFGTQKAKIIIFIIVLIPSVIGGTGFNVKPPLWISNVSDGVFVAAFILAGIFSYIISMMISFRIIEKKEFN